LIRVGTGFDIHRMESGRRCVIGGVEIPHDSGPLGHSDGDVLLHALVDAILGAVCAGDIGTLFPDTNPKYKDMKSEAFVEEALRTANDKGYALSSVDSVVFAESPRLGPHREIICQNIAHMLSLDFDCVSVKAKTYEGLGAIGRGDAVAAQVVAVLCNKE